MIRLLLLAIAIALAVAQAAAQTPDTTTAARYLPLSVGNEWHYLGSSRFATPSFDSRERYRVLSEAPAGLFSVDIRIWTASAAGWVETARTEAWRYNPFTHRVDGPTNGVAGVARACPLNAPFGAGVQCGTGPGVTGVEGGYQQAVRVGTDVVLTSAKRFVSFYQTSNQGVTQTTEYGAGVGETFYENRSIGATSPYNYTVRRDLMYARLGGVERGTAMTFPTAGEDASEAAALALSVGPNPARAAATVRYTLAAPAAVRVTVVDVLGRAVARPVDGARAAGPHAEALGVAGLPAGVYAVRLEVDGRTVVRRLSVVR